jgi:hypothetical protein
MEHRDPKTLQNIDHKVHFKPILTHNIKTWTLIERNETNMQVMGMKFLRNIEEE